jgi:hypothetical protein
MLVADLGLPRHPVNCAIARKTPLEVKNDVDTVFEEEVNDDSTAEILAYVGRDSECQVIIDETDVCCRLSASRLVTPFSTAGNDGWVALRFWPKMQITDKQKRHDSINRKC